MKSLMKEVCLQSFFDKKKQKVVSRLAREIFKIYRLIFAEKKTKKYVDLNKSARSADLTRKNGNQ